MTSSDPQQSMTRGHVLPPALPPRDVFPYSLSECPRPRPGDVSITRQTHPPLFLYLPTRLPPHIPFHVSLSPSQAPSLHSSSVPSLSLFACKKRCLHSLSHSVVFPNSGHWLYSKPLIVAPDLYKGRREREASGGEGRRGLVKMDWQEEMASIPAAAERRPFALSEL